MNKSQITLDRVFIASIDSKKAFVDYNEYILDPEGELDRYMLQLFAFNYDNTSAKKATFDDDSFVAAILPQNPEGFDAFVDVISDKMHTMLEQSVEMLSGTGLFIWATVEEQPIIAFFKLNFQTRFTCSVKDGSVKLEKSARLLPAHTQKEYDFFYINLFERQAWMSDAKCHVNGEYVNFMADVILELSLRKSEKESVKILEQAALDTIKECYEQEAPQKIFKYRQEAMAEAKDFDVLTPQNTMNRVFQDKPEAVEVYKAKLEDMQVPLDRPVEVSKKTKTALKKKQKIVTENGIEISVPVALLENKEVFSYEETELGTVTIRIHDTKSEIK
ncbi:MAG: hypothetical protein MJ105_04030 [Lachnospiraceae bacterium]|nr:hypothetical protein [Lachnospiraceae bacterium]